MLILNEVKELSEIARRRNRQGKLVDGQKSDQCKVGIPRGGVHVDVIVGVIVCTRQSRGVEKAGL